MPYIVKEKREVLDPAIEQLRQAIVRLELDNDDGMNNTEGNLNYAITTLLMTVYGDRNNTRYKQINDAIGVLGCITQEYYRKVAAPYEDQKEFENGVCTPLE